MTVALLIATMLAQAPDAGTPAPRPVSPRTFTQRVEISADRLQIQGKTNQAVWIGRVRAKRGDTRLSCDRLIAHYTAAQEISRIECLGSVEIQDNDRWAKGERAEFDNVRGILVVTGAPEARQGPNHMRGTKVTFHMEKDLIEVQDPKVIIQTGAAPDGATPQGRRR